MSKTKYNFHKDYGYLSDKIQVRRHAKIKKDLEIESAHKIVQTFLKKSEKSSTFSNEKIIDTV